jgi:hypothetical protein
LSELAALLDQLDDVQMVKDGREYWALCPCHDDHNPSLHVEVKNERLLAHCFACGVSLTDVLNALDIPTNGKVDTPTVHVRRLTIEANRSHAPDFEDSYAYRGDDGREYVKHRIGRGDDKRIWWDPAPERNLPLSLYRDVAEAIERGDVIHLVEGEEDVHAIERAGGIGTTSGGTGSWKAHHVEALRGARLVIVRDADAAGRKHAQTVRRSLLGIAESVKVVEPLNGKDADDHLSAGHPLASFVPADRFQRFDLGEAMERGIASPPFLVQDVLYEERAHALAGAPGDGKTLLMLALAADLIADGHLVAWFDEENGPAVVGGRLLSLGATPEDVTACFAYYPFAEPTLDDADELAAEMAALDPQLVVFDSGADLYVASALNENDNMDMTRWALAFSQRLTRGHGIATVVLEHVAKAGDGSYQRGAGAKKAKVDALWMLEVRAPFDHETVGEIELVRKKDRLAHLPPKVRYRIGGDGTGTTIFERIDVADEQDMTTRTARLKWEAFTNEVVAVLTRERAQDREHGLSQRQLTGLLSPATQTYKNEIVQTLAASPMSRVRSAAGPRNSLIYWLDKEVSDD